MPGKLDGKVALITGGARGMGATEARIFAREGAAVIIGDVLDEQGASVAKAIRDDGGKAVYHSLDVASQEAWKRVIKSVEEEFSALHILVNNAGINVRYQVTDMDLGDWDRILAINLTGPMRGIR
ncbi:MAG: SDR family NAD(P)-dependent oxidoreductase [Desulfatitalea sp.]|nr:SDR family NAD(P)-dependent oxidoreductase [Desulfatitalea sp.]